MNRIKYITNIITLFLVPVILVNYILHYKSISCSNRVTIIYPLCCLILMYGLKTGQYVQSIKYNTITCLEINQLGFTISIWTIAHFLCWAYVGLACPNVFYLVLLMGIIWEVLELIFEYDRQVLQSKLLCKYVNTCDTQSKTSKESFWKKYFGLSANKRDLFYCSGGFYGQLLDILANTVGFMAGAYLHKKYL